MLGELSHIKAAQTAATAMRSCSSQMLVRRIILRVAAPVRFASVWMRVHRAGWAATGRTSNGQIEYFLTFENSALRSVPRKAGDEVNYEVLQLFNHNCVPRLQAQATHRLFHRFEIARGNENS